MRPAFMLLSLPELQKLHRSGHSPVVLREIEDNLVMQATEMRMLQGHRFDTREELLAVASNLIPQGDRLLVLYKETARSMGETSAETLQALSGHIENAAYALESVAAKAQAGLNTRAIPTDQRELITAAISTSYADLLHAAQQIQSEGGPQSVFHLNLISANERPEGPLGAFFDAAIADLETRADSAPRHIERARA